MKEQEQLNAFQRQDTVEVPVVKARWDAQAKRESEGLYRSREAGRLAILEAVRMHREVMSK